MGKINTVEFNDDASVIASGSFDATVRLWDIKYVSVLAVLISVYDEIL